MSAIRVNYLIFSCLFLLGLQSCSSPKIISVEEYKKGIQTQIFQYGPDTVHARGISVLKNQLFTANNNGLVYLFDLETKKQTQLSQLELPELRDIYVLSEDFFIAMQSKEESVLLRSNKLVESISSPFPRKTFLDGVDINQNGFGIVMGDPLEGKLQIAVTHDFGLTWIPCLNEELKAFDGEAGFAASGSIVQVLKDSTFIFVTGGKKARFFKTNNFGKSWKSVDLNFLSSEASGPFSVHFWDEKNGIVVGGNYTAPNDTIQNCFLTNDGGLTWKKPLKTTSGYKSCVVKNNGVLYACGSNGIDFSLDDGNTWNKFSDENSLAMTCWGNKCYVTLNKGRILEIFNTNH